MKTITIERALAERQDSSPSGHFSGEVYLQRLALPPSGGEIEIAAVYFSAGARNKPHVHEHDQYLQIMEGRGIVAFEDERRTVSAGDMVLIPGGTWHWHGATRDSAMMHLSIRLPDQGRKAWDVPLKDWEQGYH